MNSSRADEAIAKVLNIAVVEDDEILRERVLLPGLRDYGFVVTGAASAEELYRHMISRQFDIVVLDHGLPGEDGLSIARYLREASDVGLVMLTANRDKQDRVRALQESMDVFLNKPVDIDILAATIHSLSRRLSATPLRRDKQRSTWRLEAGGWRLIAPNESIVALTAPEHCVLSVLMAEMGKPKSREELIELLTADVYDFDPHRLDMIVHRLRRKVEDQTDEVLPLLTLRGAGYFFAPPKAQ